jgi:GTPase
MLIDEVLITVKGGNGGNGAISFKRNAQTARGGPDGGNGGHGGSVFVTASHNVDTLTQFRYQKLVKAQDGGNGGKYNLYGKNGKDTTIHVPVGTVITDLDSKETFEAPQGKETLLAKGGKGGRGNNEFKSATQQAPKYRELGEAGELKNIKLEIKFVADIGLVGLPNAGKSSLLAALTNAHPKIADYPFTTLEPSLGVLDKLVIADIPGLIEGASEGKGLGDKFLKHIERTKALIYCIDSSALNPVEDYKIIRKELESFKQELLEKKEFILLTKKDLVSEEIIDQITKDFKKMKIDVRAVSVYSEEDIESLKKLLPKLF